MPVAIWHEDVGAGPRCQEHADHSGPLRIHSPDQRRSAIMVQSVDVKARQAEQAPRHQPKSTRGAEVQGRLAPEIPCGCRLSSTLLAEQPGQDPAALGVLRLQRLMKQRISRIPPLPDLPIRLTEAGCILEQICPETRHISKTAHLERALDVLAEVEHLVPKSKLDLHDASSRPGSNLLKRAPILKLQLWQRGDEKPWVTSKEGCGHGEGTGCYPRPQHRP
mmetsp:Transcript_42571/g.92732  ORF Transcript_42571/g.92732 Transcript_42571/m.92732 type:complete len:221 (-) Transcript_42571:7-669(-)